MQRTPVVSSMVSSVGYDPKEHIMEVEFFNSKQVYHYFEVPRKTFLGLMKAPSKGQYMNQFIIDHYYTLKVE